MSSDYPPASLVVLKLRLEQCAFVGGPKWWKKCCSCRLGALFSKVCSWSKWLLCCAIEFSKKKYVGDYSGFPIIFLFSRFGGLWRLPFEGLKQRWLIRFPATVGDPPQSEVNTRDAGHWAALRQTCSFGGLHPPGSNVEQERYDQLCYVSIWAKAAKTTQKKIEKNEIDSRKDRQKTIIVFLQENGGIPAWMRFSPWKKVTSMHGTSKKQTQKKWRPRCPTEINGRCSLGLPAGELVGVAVWGLCEILMRQWLSQEEND